MKLYLVQAIGPDLAYIYDVYDGFVIAAESEKAARKIAQDKIADESRVSTEFWLSSVYSSCEEVILPNEAGIVLSSFKAG